MVRDFMHEIDPNGLKQRKSGCLLRRDYYAAGPNEQWCFDGHNKLIKYSLAILGCVDAFTGKIMWLTTFTTNHDPRVMLKNYLQCVKKVGGKKFVIYLINTKAFPITTRSDYGTETVHIATIQIALHDVKIIIIWFYLDA